MNSGEMDVWAVIVTYNRPELLRRCIGAVKAQTVKPTKILVVDNACDELAADVLRDMGEDLTCLRLEENTGGAGGFHVGLKIAMEGGADAAWLMDDDGLPDNDCLEHLVGAAVRNPDSLLNPLVVSETDEDFLCFGLARGRKLIFSRRAIEKLSVDGEYEGAVSPFNGTLVTRATFARLGNVKFECFIWGDDVDYSQRARKRGVRLATVLKAVHRHPVRRGSLVSLGPLGRVRIAPRERAHIMYRNSGFLSRVYSPFYLTVLRFSANFVVYTVKIGPSEGRRYAKYFWDGFRDRYSLPPSRKVLSGYLTKFSIQELDAGRGAASGAARDAG